jgi:hypothetical protein
MPASSTSPPTKQSYNAPCHVLTTAHVYDEDDIDMGKYLIDWREVILIRIYRLHTCSETQWLKEIFLLHAFILFVLPDSGPNM